MFAVLLYTSKRRVNITAWCCYTAQTCAFSLQCCRLCIQSWTRSACIPAGYSLSSFMEAAISRSVFWSEQEEEEEEGHSSSLMIWDQASPVKQRPTYLCNLALSLWRPYFAKIYLTINGRTKTVHLLWTSSKHFFFGCLCSHNLIKWFSF